MIIRTTLILTAVLVLLAGCDKPVKRDIHITPNNDLKKPSISIRDLNGKPLINVSQLISYEWTSHTLTLSSGTRDKLYNALSSSLVRGHPFTLNINDKVVYSGNFTTSLSSTSLDSVVINLFPSPDLSEDQIQIQLGYPTQEVFQGEDPRQNQWLKDSLETLGKLR